MFRFSVEWLRLPFRRPRRLLFHLLLFTGIVLVTGLLATGLAGANLWAWHHYRAAQDCLDRYRFADAQAHLDHCLEIWPSSFNAHLLAAQAARRLGDFEAAEQHLARCQEIHRGLSPEVEMEQLLIRAQRGGMDSVMPYFRSLVEQDHPASRLIFEAMAQGYMRAYRYGDAGAIVGLWRERWPDDIEANLFDGYVNEVIGSQKHAVESFQHVLELDPENDEARIRLADLLIDRATPAEALIHLEHLARKRPDDLYIQTRLSRCLLALGRPEEAEQLIDRVLAQMPHLKPALAVKGESALTLGRAPEAEPWLREALAVDHGNLQTQHLLARCLREQGKDKDAAAAEERLKMLEADGQRIRRIIEFDINKSPNDPALRTELGNILIRAGSNEDGVKWLNSALKYDPAFAPAHRALAEYYERNGPRERAAPHRRFLEGGGRPEASSSP